MSLRVEADVTDVVEALHGPSETIEWTRRVLMAFAAAADRWASQDTEPATIGVLVATHEGMLGQHVGTVSDVAREVTVEDLHAIVDAAARMRVALERLVPTDYLFHQIGSLGVDIAAQNLLESVGFLLTQGCVEQRPTVVDGGLVVRWMTTIIATFDVRRFDVAHASKVLTTTCNALGES